MVRDGIYYAVGLIAGGGVVGYLAHPVLGTPLYLLAVFCLYFFRDPERVVPAGPVAVSPADGKIVAVKTGVPGRVRISMFSAEALGKSGDLVVVTFKVAQGSRRVSAVNLSGFVDEGAVPVAIKNGTVRMKKQR